MFPPELLTLDALRTAAFGAGGGLVLGLGIYAFRDRHVLAHRLHKRRQIAAGNLDAHNWSDEPDGYLPDGLTEKERAELPTNLAATALVGAAWLLSTEYESSGLLFLLAAGVLIIQTLWMILGDNAEVLDAGATEEVRPVEPAARWRVLVWNLALLAFLAVTILDPVRDAFWRLFETAPYLVYGVGAIVAGSGFWALATARDEDSDMPMWQSYDIPREAVYGFVGALVMVGVIVALATVM